MLPQYVGLQITFSSHALEKTKERLFPESKHRSKRLHKKLCKRYGGEFKMVPCMFRTPHGILAHPAYRAELERHFAARSSFTVEYEVVRREGKVKGVAVDTPRLLNAIATAIEKEPG